MLSFDYIRNLVSLSNTNGTSSGTTQKILTSLALYRDRGEFDGNLTSAIVCLVKASYEVDLDALYYVMNRSEINSFDYSVCREQADEQLAESIQCSR